MTKWFMKINSFTVHICMIVCVLHDNNYDVVCRSHGWRITGFKVHYMYHSHQFLQYRFSGTCCIFKLKGFSSLFFSPLLICINPYALFTFKSWLCTHGSKLGIAAPKEAWLERRYWSWSFWAGQFFLFLCFES